MFKPSLLLLLTGFAAIVSAAPQPWWQEIQAMFDDSVVNLKQCSRKNNIAPMDGEKCSKRAKTCFFGEQDCNGSPYPTERCVCSGRPERQWDCEPEACPAPIVTAPPLPCADFDHGNDAACPVSQVQPGSTCTEEGISCSWGTDFCCDQCNASFGCSCEAGSWLCFFFDSCLGANLPGGCNYEITPLDPADAPPCPASDPGSCSVRGQQCQFITSVFENCDEATQTGFMGDEGLDCICDGSSYRCDNAFANASPCFPEPTTPCADFDHQNDALCPATQAGTGGACPQEGLSCTWGTDFCCDTCFPEFGCSCSGGQWGCFFQDSCLTSQLPGGCDAPEPLVIELPPCADFVHDNDAACPATQASTGGACPQDGLSCTWGTDYCCGQCFPEFGCSCSGGQWGCFFLDSCLGGCGPIETLDPALAPPCPAKQTTTCTILGQQCDFTTSESENCDAAAQTGFISSEGLSCICDGAAYQCDNAFANIAPCFP